MRERTLGEARAALTQLPDLVSQLARTLTERHHDVNGYRAKVSGSPAPLSIPVVHLTDTRHKPGWAGDDPRVARAGDRYGITPMLTLWVRVLTEELPEYPELTETATIRSECAVLLEHWPFIENADWGIRLADDVNTAFRTVKAHLGIRPPYQPKCRKCASTVVPVDASRVLTSWEAAAYGSCTGCEWVYPTGPALVALGQAQQPMPLADIAAMVGVPVKTLHRWHAEGLITPATNGQRRNRLYDLAAVREVVARVRTA